MRTFQKVRIIRSRSTISLQNAAFPICKNADIDRFDSSQTVRTMMLCFVFSAYYTMFSAACQAVIFLFTKNSHLKLVCCTAIHFGRSQENPV